MLRVAIAGIPELAGGGDAGAPAGIGDVPAPAWFGDAERRRWAGLAPVARGEFAASRRLLRQLLEAVTGLEPARWDISAESGQAPVARPTGDHAFGAVPQASLSHRLGWVAAAVCSECVGVDIECERPARSDPADRAALMLAPAELAAWLSQPDREREPTLLAHWVAKEAWFKASSPQAAPWDFRQVLARACAPALANVRVWRAPPLHVAVSCPDAQALAAVECEGLDLSAASSSSWHVGRVLPGARISH